MSFGLGSVSAGLALVSPEDIDGTFGITLGAEVGTILENLDARADLIWWSTSEGTTGAEASFRDIGILPGVRYHFSMGEDVPITPFADGGLGIHLFKAEVDTFLGSVSDTTTEIGIFFGGGAAYEISDTMTLAGIARFNLMDVNFITFGAEISIDL